jgi:hypothetical protein
MADKEDIFCVLKKMDDAINGISLYLDSRSLLPEAELAILIACIEISLKNVENIEFAIDDIENILQRIKREFLSDRDRNRSRPNPMESFPDTP